MSTIVTLPFYRLRVVAYANKVHMQGTLKVSIATLLSSVLFFCWVKGRGGRRSTVCHVVELLALNLEVIPGHLVAYTEGKCSENPEGKWP